MRTRRLLAFLVVLLLPLAAAAELSQQLQQQLATGKYVYISSTRKDGSLSKPAEIWYLWHDNAVYVGTRPTSWRVRRIKAGRPQAKIAVGSVDAASFMATGSLVSDPKIEALLMRTFAEKYPDGWTQHEESFRQGFKDRTRVIVKYVPTP
ncbi:hypothetical protein KF840_04965 [bacterium]|nr:hypothetical protein [bacterium]